MGRAKLPLLILIMCYLFTGCKKEKEVKELEQVEVIPVCNASGCRVLSEVSYKLDNSGNYTANGDYTHNNYDARGRLSSAEIALQNSTTYYTYTYSQDTVFVSCVYNSGSGVSAYNNFYVKNEVDMILYSSRPKKPDGTNYSSIIEINYIYSNGYLIKSESYFSTAYTYVNKNRVASLSIAGSNEFTNIYDHNTTLLCPLANTGFNIGLPDRNLVKSWRQPNSDRYESYLYKIDNNGLVTEKYIDGNSRTDKVIYTYECK